MNLAEAHSRLEEVVSAIRDISTMTSREWQDKHAAIYDISNNHPLSLGSGSWERRVHNLQIELQIRTAEFLLVQYSDEL